MIKLREAAAVFRIHPRCCDLRLLQRADPIGEPLEGAMTPPFEGILGPAKHILIEPKKKPPSKVLTVAPPLNATYP